MIASEIMIPNPPTCSPEDSLARAARIMTDSGSSAIPVVSADDAKRLVGVMIPEDLVRAAAEGAAMETTPVSRYAQSGVITVSPEQALESLELTSPGLPPQLRERPIVVIDDRQRVVGMIPRPEIAIRTAELEQGREPIPLNFRSETMQLVWVCTNCGYWQPRDQPLPSNCPNCSAPREEFVLHTEQ